MTVIPSLLLLVACRGPLGSEGNPVKVAVVASQDREQTEAVAERVVAALHEQTGLSYVAQVPEKYVDMVLALGEQRADVAFTNVMAYLLAHDAWKAHAVLAVERSGATDYRGAVYVPADRGWTDLTALQGARVAVVDLYSTSGYVLPATLLERQGVHPAELVPAHSHAEVVRMVYDGEVDAGFAYLDARDELVELRPDVTSRVAVLATTDPVPNEPVVARDGLPPDVLAKVVAGLQALAGTGDGAAALRDLHGITAFHPVTDADYDPVRAALGELGKQIDEMVPGGGLVRLEQRRPKEPIPPLGG